MLRLQTHFVFLGPDKSGSSWIHEHLSARPDVSAATSKELFFFSGESWARGVDWYEGQFQPVPGPRAEVCHDYLFDPRCYQRINSTYPQARIALALRDPAERAFSSYLYMLRQGRISGSFNKALNEMEELIDHGRYGSYVASLQDIFDETSILLLNFDEFTLEPQRWADQLAAHIGLPKVVLTEKEKAPVRKAARARSVFAASAGRRIGTGLRQLGFHHLVSTVKNNAVVEKALFSSYGNDRPALELADRERIYEVLVDDAILLDAIAGTNSVNDRRDRLKALGPAEL